MAVYGGLVTVGALAAGAVVVGVGALSDRGSETAAAEPAHTAGPADSAGAVVAPAAADAWCPAVSDGGRVLGAGPGDTSSGAGLILAMQYGMYVNRDPHAVRAVFAPSSVVASPEDTRAAIAAIPTGTRHCVSIVAQALDRYAVSVTEVHPDRSIQTWNTAVTTGIQPDGRLRVTAIVPLDRSR